MGKLSKNIKEATKNSEVGAEVLEQAEERLREYEEIHSIKSFMDIIGMLECDDDDDELIADAISQSQEVIGGRIADIPIAEPLSDPHRTLDDSADEYAEIDSSVESIEAAFGEQTEQLIIRLDDLF